MAKIYGYAPIESAHPAAVFAAANASIWAGESELPGARVFVAQRRGVVAACFEMDSAELPSQLLSDIQRGAISAAANLVADGGSDIVASINLRWRAGCTVWRSPCSRDHHGSDCASWAPHVVVASLGTGINLPVPAVSRPEGRGIAAVIELRGDIGLGRNGAPVVLGQIAAAAQYGKSIAITIDSDGGPIADGEEIYRALAAHPFAVHVAIEERANSAAALVAMAGDTRVISRSGSMLLHPCHLDSPGKLEAADLLRTANLMAKYDQRSAGIFAARTGMDRDIVAEWISSSTTFDAGTAVRLGLVHAIDRHYVPAKTAPAAKARFAPINGPYRAVRVA